MDRYYAAVLQSYSLDKFGNLYFARLPITVPFDWMETPTGVVETKRGSRKYELQVLPSYSPANGQLITFLRQFEHAIQRHVNSPGATFHSCIQSDNRICIRMPTSQDRINLTIVDENATAGGIVTYFDIRAGRQVSGKIQIKSVWKILDGDTIKHYGIYICLLECRFKLPSALRSSQLDNMLSVNNDTSTARRVQWAIEPTGQDNEEKSGDS